MPDGIGCFDWRGDLCGEGRGGHRALRGANVLHVAMLADAGYVSRSDHAGRREMQACLVQVMLGQVRLHRVAKGDSQVMCVM